MSDLESFSSFESVSQGSDPESFRLFQERMKVAAAQIKAIKAGEQKQKKSEDELAKVLANFIKEHQQSQGGDQFLMMISSLLALNTPAIFILSILILNFPQLQKESGIKLLSFDEAMRAGGLESDMLPDIYLGRDKLPLGVKVAIDSWIQEINHSTKASRGKILKTSLVDGKAWHHDIVNSINLSLLHYLEKNNLQMEHSIISKFVDLFMTGILENLLTDTHLLPEN